MRRTLIQERHNSESDGDVVVGQISTGISIQRETNLFCFLSAFHESYSSGEKKMITTFNEM